MLILSSPSKLRLLEEMLRKIRPQALAVCGVVMNINRGNPVGHEVIVDSWPEFKVILTRKRRETFEGNHYNLELGSEWNGHPVPLPPEQHGRIKQVPSEDSDIFTNTYAAFYRDFNVYQTLLLDSDAVNWSQCFAIRGNQDGIYEASRNAVTAKQTLLSKTSYITYFSSEPNKLREYKLHAGFRFSSLNHSHVDLLNETWPYGGNEQSRRYLATLVRCFPSICVLDTSDNPISWGLMDPFGAGAHGYTLPSYRGKGFSSMVTKAMGMQVSAAGYLSYGIVAEENIQMQRIMEYLGVQRLDDLCHICVHHTV